MMSRAQKETSVSERGGAWDEKEIRDLVRLWRDGAKNSEIAKALGRSANAISVKASRIGLPPKDRIPDMPSTMKVRSCLRCRSQFFSEGPGNRICGTCKGSDEWKSGGGYRIMS